MKNRIFLMLAFCIGLVACGENLPDNEFDDMFTLEDFKLDQQYDYWEIRRGSPQGSKNQNFEVIKSFDDDNYKTLSKHQKNLLEQVSSKTGFATQCLPGNCPVYGVAIKGNEVRVIASQADLLDFFYLIDTEAELKTYLDFLDGYVSFTGHQAFLTSAKTYNRTKTGFMVELEWDTLCQLRGSDLVRVNSNGKIEPTKEIEQESYNGCV